MTTTIEERFDKLMNGLEKALASIEKLSQDNKDLTDKIMEMSTKTTANTDATSDAEATSLKTMDSSKSMFLKNNRKVKPERPKCQMGIEQSDWNLFLDEWTRYKMQVGMDNVEDAREIVLELRNAVSKEVNQQLCNFVGTENLLQECVTEDVLLGYIKFVAVNQVSKHVHRRDFSRIVQSPGECVTKLVGRLKTEAAQCEFSVQCQADLTCCGVPLKCSKCQRCMPTVCRREVSYAESMISQQLTSGIINPEHQAKIIAEADRLHNLEGIVARLIGLEQTDEAQAKLRGESSSSIAAPHRFQSQYKKDKRRSSMSPSRKEHHQANRSENNKRVHFDSNKKKVYTKRKCRGCGKSSHGKNKYLNRKDCPAWGHECSCGMKNHYDSVCEQRSKANFMIFDEWDTSCSSMSEESMRSADESELEEKQDFHATSVRCQDFREARRPANWK